MNDRTQCYNDRLKMIRKNHKLNSFLIGETEHELDFPTLESHDRMCTFYHSKIFELSKLFTGPPSVPFVAVIYFSKFYTKTWTLMDYDGAAISIVSFFLASKVENVHMSLEDILTKIGQAGTSKLPPIDALFRLEIILVNSLSFHLKVDLFYDVLYGLSLQLSSTHPTIFEIYTKALERLSSIYSFAPSWWIANVNGPLLGIAVFSLEISSEQVETFESFLQKYVNDCKKIEEIKEFLTSSFISSKEFDFKRIAMKIASCRLDDFESPLAKKIEEIRTLQTK